MALGMRVYDTRAHRKEPVRKQPDPLWGDPKGGAFPLMRSYLDAWGALVSLLSSWPYRAHYGLLWWPVSDANWTY